MEAETQAMEDLLAFTLSEIKTIFIMFQALNRVFSYKYSLQWVTKQRNGTLLSVKATTTTAQSVKLVFDHVAMKWMSQECKLQSGLPRTLTQASFKRGENQKSWTECNLPKVWLPNCSPLEPGLVVHGYNHSTLENRSKRTKNLGLTWKIQQISEILSQNK